MARVNIEECWWSDPRRTVLAKLVGDEVMANGLAVMMWRVAQEFWAKGELVPKHIWATVQANSKLIQANLAEEQKDGIYVRGSSQYFDWVVERRKAAQAGGQKSAQRPRDSKGRLVKTSKQSPSKTQVTSKRIQASGSFSGSGSDSGSKISFPSETTPQSVCGAAVAKKPSSGVKANFLIARYCEWFKSKYGFNPDIMQKQAGIAKRISKSMTEERMAKLLDAYFNMPEGWLEKRKHPLELFEMKLNEIAAFAENGQFTTTGQVRSLDQGTNVHSQLERIRRGEL